MDKYEALDITDKSISMIDYNNNIQLIDIGLPSGNLWADRNIGADSPEQKGLYFAWGETDGFSVEHVKTKIRRFNWPSYKAKQIAADLMPEHDAARAYLGEYFHMPTKEDFEELLSNCYSTITYNYKGTKVTGRVLTSKINGNSIFLPAAGRCRCSSVYGVGEIGLYWSASCDLSLNAWGLFFYYRNPRLESVIKSCGRSVRAVYNSHNNLI